MKKVIVTGGAGFIGSHVVDMLVRENYSVHVIDDLSAGNREHVNPAAILHECSILDQEQLKSLFTDVHYVFHLAALPRVQDSINDPITSNLVNVQGTVNVLHAAAQARVKRFIFASSSSIYGDAEQLPLTELMPPRPMSPYALQKSIGEQYCKLFSEQYQLPTVCLRYFNVYGPRASHYGSYPLVIARFLHQKKTDEPLTICGDGKQTRDFTHVYDVAHANLLAATSDYVGTGEIINIGSGVATSVNTIAELINHRTMHLPARTEPRNTLADIRFAKLIMDWEPSISLEKGITELLAQNPS